MRLTFLMLACLVLIISITQVLGACTTCGATGSDYCTCQEQVPRPSPRFLGKLLDTSQQYQPIGDTCSCGHTIVQPAIPPKPFQNTGSLEPPQRPFCQEQAIRAPESYQGPNVHPNLVYGNKPEHRPLPADAVSLSLAYQLARSLRRPVPEDKIQYGFRTAPVNGAIEKAQVNVPEEKLWSVNRAIVELKGTSIPSNSEDEDDEDEAAEDEARSPNYLTYGDIGYCPEKFPNKSFHLKTPSAPTVSRCSNNPLPPSAIGDCGYKPGKITSYQGEYEKNEHRGIEDCYEDH